MKHQIFLLSLILVFLIAVGTPSLGYIKDDYDATKKCTITEERISLLRFLKQVNNSIEVFTLEGNYKVIAKLEKTKENILQKLKEGKINHETSRTRSKMDFFVLRGWYRHSVLSNFILFLRRILWQNKNQDQKVISD